jgi:hypothetical protein
MKRCDELLGVIGAYDTTAGSQKERLDHTWKCELPCHLYRISINAITGKVR